MAYWPSASDSALREKAVLGLVRVTCAPGTAAPLWSRMRPRKAAWSRVCATANKEKRTRKTAKNVRREDIDSNTRNSKSYTCGGQGVCKEAQSWTCSGPNRALRATTATAPVSKPELPVSARNEAEAARWAARYLRLAPWCWSRSSPARAANSRGGDGFQHDTSAELRRRKGNTAR